MWEAKSTNPENSGLRGVATTSSWQHLKRGGAAGGWGGCTCPKFQENCQASCLEVYCIYILAQQNFEKWPKITLKLKNMALCKSNEG